MERLWGFGEVGRRPLDTPLGRIRLGLVCSLYSRFLTVQQLLTVPKPRCTLLAQMHCRHRTVHHAREVDRSRPLTATTTGGWVDRLFS